jgi:DNA-binding HxlR family transcriptional regulator
MKRTSFADMNCSLARALEDVGEWWSLMIVREAMYGTRRFDGFCERLGIARNVLTTRLNRLVEVGVLTREPAADDPRFSEYVLTAKGRDLLPVLAALLHWGDRWRSRGDGPPVVITEIATGREVQPMLVRTVEGDPLDLEDVVVAPGPGATSQTRDRLAERARRRDEATADG